MALKGRHRRKTTNEAKKHEPKIKEALKTSRKNNMQENKPYISTGFRRILAIVSLQISTMTNPPMPSWSTKQPIDDKKSAHVT